MSSYQVRWLCICDCGTEAILPTKKISTGEVSSCGCWRRTWSIKHGKSRTLIYALWNGMIGRCLNEKHESFRNYGGRGITVCDRWKKFENFYEDMGERPEGCTLNRVNNDGPYSPENCKWSTYAEQADNTRTSRLVTFNGKTMSISKWKRELKLPLFSRIHKGWSIEKAFTSPVRNRGGKST